MSDSTKILVLGPKGMLGQAVLMAAATAGHVARGTIIDVRVIEQVQAAAGNFKPDAVINCAGVIPLKKAPDHVVVQVNALAPHLIASVFGCHVVQVSTDCVFSGKRKHQNYTIYDLPDPNTLYGRSKLCGELNLPHTTTVRTSFVGRSHGLVKWLLDQPQGATIDGWDGALWSGSTVTQVAKHLVEIALGPPMGLVHLATRESISKYRLLDLARTAVNRLDLYLRYSAEPHINRALEPTVVLPRFADVVSELVA